MSVGTDSDTTTRQGVTYARGVPHILLVNVSLSHRGSVHGLEGLLEGSGLVGLLAVGEIVAADA